MLYIGCVASMRGGGGQVHFFDHTEREREREREREKERDKTEGNKARG